MKSLLSSNPPEFCGLKFWAVVCDEGPSDALDDWEELVEDMASTTRSGS